MKNLITKYAIAVSVALGMSSVSLHAQADLLANSEVKFSGYIKADAIFSSYSDGTLSSQSVGRDFYIPGLTPVGGIKESTQFDAHAKQSRFQFTSTTKTDEGDTITGVLEIDFLVTPGGNERVSNSYVPRIRHGFIKYKAWTVGQTWTTFQDVKTLPETLDFIGVPDGVAFDRQALVRYQSGAWEFALENSESTITPFGGGTRIVSDDSSLPDAVVRYTHKADWGHLSVAGIVRQLRYVEGDLIDDSASSAGVSINSKINFDNGDDLRISLTSGSGLGRYVALNTANGAVLDANGNLKSIDSTAFALSYRHLWNSKMRSSVTYAQLTIDNDTALTGLGVNSATSSMSANLLYSPTKKITVGAEIKQATREIESGLDGDMTRLQFSMKYAF
ncbi:porin [Glaciecola sp. MH2013]|uniref:DcaP family trimeric outer membrane transporter n=1 Tax=Glaciecola sp. MH2013 TaxID=2785524 RepID=UPI00189EC609|nr:DcaP family trimeric outer membrane transporter [Glaciecola sp. MH2013]MBF7071956.1 porin [Glaciecola sp. MH2013]